MWRLELLELDTWRHLGPAGHSCSRGRPGLGVDPLAPTLGLKSKQGWIPEKTGSRGQEGMSSDPTAATPSCWTQVGLASKARWQGPSTPIGVVVSYAVVSVRFLDSPQPQMPGALTRSEPLFAALRREGVGASLHAGLPWHGSGTGSQSPRGWAQGNSCDKMGESSFVPVCVGLLWLL